MTRQILRIARYTCAAQIFNEDAIEAVVDACIRGEIFELTADTAIDVGIHFFAAEHHATERDGAQEIGNYFAARSNLEHSLFDIDNPV